jgi:hypothetical protein
MIKIGNPPYLECSSKGFKPFSAFYARIKSRDNKSIEELYQAYKIFEDGSTGLSWQEANGLSDIFGQKDHCCQAVELWRIKLILEKV